MKKLANLVGSKLLKRNEQKMINGGAHSMCESHSDCPGGQGCCFSVGLCFRDDYPGLEQPGGWCWN